MRERTMDEPKSLWDATNNPKYMIKNLLESR